MLLTPIAVREPLYLRVHEEMEVANQPITVGTPGPHTVWCAAPIPTQGLSGAAIDFTLRMTTLSTDTPQIGPPPTSRQVADPSCVNSKRSCDVVPAMPGRRKLTCCAPSESPA